MSPFGTYRRCRQRADTSAVDLNSFKKETDTVLRLAADKAKAAPKSQ
jgi:hypothetical protein